MSCRETPDFDESEVLMYKKLHKKASGNPWIFSTFKGDEYPPDIILSIVLSAAAWPVMIWYWTKSYIWPIFSILLSTALLAICFNLGSFYLYVLIGYFSALFGITSWLLIGFAHGTTPKHREMTIKEWSDHITKDLD